ncbi:competence type IV pilus major pilin ComGC [Apilactobacillus xinyiensis]|uniref:competence type IV pilus major pilin ComGC n=1 Tax=Apilactobacillus xinyiensis TaxID=2841032 RepID=UPI0024B1D130|nr:competence type IV pilus major pilin ComGC [Apilactobacillus xinyiensis]
MHKNKPAFTLIEMTVVLFIISLLILIIVPNLSSQKSKANKIHANAMTLVIQNQIDSYLDDKDGKVDYSSLQNDGYLTEKQVKSAKQMGLSIRDNKVVNEK